MPILALVTEYQGVLDEQVVVLFQILAAEINFGYRFQTVRCLSLNGQEVCNLRSLATLVDRCQCAPHPSCVKLPHADAEQLCAVGTSGSQHHKHVLSEETSRSLCG